MMLNPMKTPLAFKLRVTQRKYERGVWRITKKRNMSLKYKYSYSVHLRIALYGPKALSGIMMAR
jgi:hypothetical protein